MPCLIGLAAMLLQGAACAETLTVAVAANVQYAFGDISALFLKETGIEVNGTIGATGKFAAQIRNGAPFDILIAADSETPDALYKQGATAGSPTVYAQGALVLWTTRDLDLGRGMEVLTESAVQKVAVPNPRLAPYGRAAVEALQKAGLEAKVAPKLVYGESIAQATQYVDTGAADAGFTAKSIVLAENLKAKGKWVEIPRDDYAPITQSVVELKHGEAAHPVAARKFIEFLFTPEARAIFQKYGYILP